MGAARPSALSSLVESTEAASSSTACPGTPVEYRVRHQQRFQAQRIQRQNSLPAEYRNRHQQRFQAERLQIQSSYSKGSTDADRSADFNQAGTPAYQIDAQRE